ncbi:MAG: hypothetical protein ACO1N0_20065 [Fluviicola sp.]
MSNSKNKVIESLIRKQGKLLQNKSFPETLLFICDMINEVGDPNNQKRLYTKEYFATYYQVDLDTLHKWIKIFCPELWNNRYSKRRKFTFEEAEYIYTRLGMYTFRETLPRNHREVSDFIYSDLNWKSSRKYHELKLELENRFPNYRIQLNILPPKLVSEILSEYMDNYTRNINQKDISFYEQRVNKMHHLLTKHGAMSERQKEIKIRWLKIWFAKS